MKFKSSTYSILLVIAVSFTSPSCEKDGDRNSSEGYFFLEAAKKTLPVITSASGIKSSVSPTMKSASGDDTWVIDNPLFVIYSMLREYDPEVENGVGIDNVYLLLNVTGNFFDETLNNGESIPDQHIEAPFDLGNNDVIYNVAVNSTEFQSGSAVRQDGSINYGIHCHMRETGGEWPATERGILQGQYNKATHDLKIDLLSFLDSDTKDIGLRISAEGNDSTHTFTIKYIKYATNEVYAYGVGHGVSKGSGNYFLFKFSTGIEENLPIRDAYYCIAATASENDMKNMDMVGSGEVIPACMIYKDIVDNIVPFTRDDLPSSASDFNKGGTGIATEGSMYLKYHAF